jgi:hypothetical protein
MQLRASQASGPLTSSDQIRTLPNGGVTLTAAQDGDADLGRDSLEPETHARLAAVQGAKASERADLPRRGRRAPGRAQSAAPRVKAAPGRREAGAPQAPRSAAQLRDAAPPGRDRPGAGQRSARSSFGRIRALDLRASAAQRPRRTCRPDRCRNQMQPKCNQRRFGRRQFGRWAWTSRGNSSSSTPTGR